MKKIKYFILLILPFLAFLSHVSADSVDITQVGYGYYYWDSNDVKQTVSWSGYNENYKYRGPSDFPTTIDGGIYVVDFGLRFHIDGNFKANKKYSLTFNWVNYNGNYINSSDNFLTRFSRLLKTIHCRETSFSSTGYDESHCFLQSEFVVSPGADSNSAVVVTWYFTPKVDFYTGIIYYYHDSNSNFKSYFSEGWEINNISWTDVTNDTQNIINNQNQNTQNIINNQNQNAQDIQNTINDNFQSCRDSVNLWGGFNQFSQTVNGVTFTYYTNGKIGAVGSTSGSSAFSLTGSVSTSNGVYVTLVPGTYTVSGDYNTIVVRAVEGGTYLTSELNHTFTLSQTTNVYLRFVVPVNTSINHIFEAQIVKGSSSKPFEEYGKQVCKNKIDETNDAINGVNDSINNSNVSDSTSDASNFFSGFTTETYGLTGVITAPLNVIQSITSKTCSPLVLPLPFVNENLTLPCMGQIYSQYFGDFLTIYQTITFGVVAYWVVVRIFNLVKDFKNPDHDEIEVLDL